MLGLQTAHEHKPGFRVIFVFSVFLIPVNGENTTERAVPYRNGEAGTLLENNGESDCYQSFE
ncbi:MAG TPA: hypothetical protein DD706_19520 [Nitrospiraceae bacterium]|nr:hypothetical protein [Nitrospiraceae bacterium]